MNLGEHKKKRFTSQENYSIVTTKYIAYLQVKAGCVQNCYKSTNSVNNHDLEGLKE
jgi:hypothetical protein